MRVAAAGGGGADMNAPTPIPPDTGAAFDHRVGLELRHARLRVAIAAATLEWAASLLADRKMNGEGALRVLDEAMDELCGDGA